MLNDYWKVRSTFRLRYLDLTYNLLKLVSLLLCNSLIYILQKLLQNKTYFQRAEVNNFKLFEIFILESFSFSDIANYLCIIDTYGIEVFRLGKPVEV